MTTVIAILALVLIVGAACTYIYKEKKRGIKCIGCPNAEGCQTCTCCSSDELYNDIHSSLSI